MKNKKPYLFLNAFLAKGEYASLTELEFLKEPNQVLTYNLDEKHKLKGKLFVKKTKEKKPTWSNFTESITGVSLDGLANRSSSAVLIIKTIKATIAFTFGYGRFLIDTKYFVHDFGIKTALNTLNHDSLRSVDLFTLEEQAVQKKSQTSREASIGVFGIDISRDILRAVTGSPKKNVILKNISGGDAVYSFAIEMDVAEIPNLVELLYNYYNNDSYKKEFTWVDNIRKVREKSEIDLLDAQLLNSIKSKKNSITITLPEIVQWDFIYGFSFTRSKHLIKPIIESNEYFKNINYESITIDTIKRDRLFVFDIYENEFEYQIYKCIYYEYKSASKNYILFSGIWYEIDNSFQVRIDATLSRINISSLIFPAIYTWEETKNKSNKNYIESEGDYNVRVSNRSGYHLLDKKLIKTNRTTTSIELCDLMTNNKQLIHVKHRKGGSAGLSHLFAQGSVSAEILLGDKEFRKETRKVLKRVSDGLQNSIPLDGFKSDGVEIVFLILGEDSATLKSNLPFFSKVNLSKAYENLSQRGFSVTIAGVEVKKKP